MGPFLREERVSAATVLLVFLQEHTWKPGVGGVGGLAMLMGPHTPFKTLMKSLTECLLS